MKRIIFISITLFLVLASLFFYKNANFNSSNHKDLILIARSDDTITGTNFAEHSIEIKSNKKIDNASLVINHDTWPVTLDAVVSHRVLSKTISLNKGSNIIESDRLGNITSVKINDIEIPFQQL